MLMKLQVAIIWLIIKIMLTVFEARPSTISCNMSRYSFSLDSAGKTHYAVSYRCEQKKWLRVSGLLILQNTCGIICNSEQHQQQKGII